MGKKSFISIMLVLMTAAVIFSFGNINFIRAQEIHIEEEDSIVKIMEDILIPEAQVVKGDVVAILGDIVIEGEVKGDVVAILGDIKVDNRIGGDLTSVMGSIQKGEKAEIGGKTTAVEVGNIKEFDIGIPPVILDFVGWNFRIFKLIILYGLALLVFSLMPEHQRRMAAALEKQPWKNLLTGFIAILILPVLFLLFLLTIIGIPLIPFLIILIIIAKFFGYVAVVYLTGSKISRISEKNINIYFIILIGVVILWILNSVPVLGIFFYFIIMFLAVGVLINTKFGTNRPWFKGENIKELPQSEE